MRTLVAAAQAAPATSSASAAPPPTELAPGLFVSALPAAAAGPASTTTCCTVALRAGGPADPGTWRRGPLAMEVGVGRQPKIASRDLRAALPRICAFVGEYLERRSSAVGTTGSRSTTTTAAIGEAQPPAEGGGGGGGGDEEEIPVRVLVACESGRDISVGVALALLCQFWEAGDPCGGGGGGGGAGPLRPRPRRELRDVDVNKAVIKARLGGIMARFPEANPSRATLQSVNSYLMG